MKHKKAHILCLQDTHLTVEDEVDLRTYWKGEILLHGAHTNSRGVAILLSDIFEYKVKNVIQDNSGNMIVLDFQMSDIKDKLINIYGPNIDDPNFYECMSNLLSENEEEYVIWCGDFNMTLNPDLDSHNYVNLNNPKSCATVMNTMGKHDLVDSFRYCYPEVRRYTWRRQNLIKQARLDYFIVSASFTDIVSKIDIIPGFDQIIQYKNSMF